MSPRSRNSASLALVAFIAAAVLGAEANGEPTDVLDEAGAARTPTAANGVELGVGDARVSTQTGAFTYQFSVAAPPGRLEAEPDIALSYSSQAPLHGGLAAGWALRIPHIRRVYPRGRNEDSHYESSLAGDRRLIFSAEPSGPNALGYRATDDLTFARYQYFPSSSTWRVLLADGTTHYFNEAAYTGGISIEHSYPLTRTVDKFGNEVRYYWEHLYDTAVSPGVIGELRIARIEYSANPGAGLGHHAEVQFTYGAPVRCDTQGKSLPVGARLSYASGERRVHGMAPLNTISTRVKRNGAFATVRTYTLQYEHSCWDSGAGQRRLVSITEAATAPGGATTSLPPIVFGYGGAAPLSATPATSVGLPGSARLLPSGLRRPFPHNASTDETRLMDVNGDGRPDWISATAAGAGCSLVVRPNLGREVPQVPIFGPRDLVFGPPQTIPLPSIPWELPQGRSGPEHCSLSGQFSMASDGNPSTGFPGAWLLYDFQDIDQDGFVDLLVGLSAVQNDLPPGAFGFTQTSCPIVNVSGVAPGLAQGPSWENPSTGPYPGHDPTREPIGSSNTCFHVKLYRNVAASGGRAFAFTSSFDTPFPLHSEARGVVPNAGSSVAGGVPQTLADMDGDGYLDFVRMRASDAQANRDWELFVYRWDSTQNRLHDGAPWSWQSRPMQDPFPAAYGVEVLGSPDDYVVRETYRLHDVNHDGFPDWIKGNEIYFNDVGTRFAAPIATPTIIEAPAALSAAETTILSNGGAPHVRADRIATLRSADLNGDMRPDLVDSTAGKVFWNLGDGSSRPATTGLPTRQFVHNEDTNSDGIGEWMTTEDFIDLDGDGLADRVIETTSGVVQIYWAEPNGAPPGRLSAVDNGRGKTVAVAYAPITDRAVVDFGTNDQPAPTWVVERLTSSHANGQTPPSTARYTYDRPVRTPDLDGRLGFRGFEVVRSISPSGSIGEQRFAYDLDWTGREVARLTYPQGSSNPSSIAQTIWAQDDLQLYGKLVPFRYSAATIEMKCETPNGNGVTILDETSCLAQSDVLAKLSSWTPVTHQDGGSQEIAYVPRRSIEGRRVTTHRVEGHVTETYSSKLYDPQTYRLVTVMSQTGVGVAQNPFFLPCDGLCAAGWNLSITELAGWRETTYDSTLRVARRVCGLRGLEDTPAGSGDGIDYALAPCAAFEHDMSTGLLLRSQTPEQRAADPGASNLAITQAYTQYGYYDASVPDSEHRTFVSRNTNALGHTVTTYVDVGTGTIVRTLGPNPHEGRYVVIDGLGRTLEEWVSTGDHSDPLIDHDFERTRLFEYQDGSPNVAIEKTSRYPGPASLINSYTSSKWTELRTTYDGSGRVISVVDWNISGNRPYKTTAHRYDAAGNHVETTLPDPSGFNDSDSVRVAYTYHYDSLGRLTCSVRPDQTGVATIYAGRTQTNVELLDDGAGGGTCSNPVGSLVIPGASAGKKTVIEDVFGRIVEVSERTETLGDARTTFTYDANSNIEEIVRLDSGGAQIVTTLSHDWLGNRIATTRHGRTWTYTYDRNGNQLTKTAPHPVGLALLYTTSIDYDLLDRPLDRIPATAAGAVPEFAVGPTTMTYDQGSNGIGRVTAVTLPFGTVDYEYDARGLETDEVRSFNLTSFIGASLADTLATEVRKFSTRGDPVILYHASGVRQVFQYLRAENIPFITNAFHGHPSQEGVSTFNCKIVASGYCRHVYHLFRDGPNGQPHILGGYFRKERDTNGRVIRDIFNDASAYPPVIGSSDLSRQDYTYNPVDEIVSMVSKVGPSTRTFQLGYGAQHQLRSVLGDHGYAATIDYRRHGQIDSVDVQSLPAAGSSVVPRQVQYEYSDPDPEIVTAMTGTTAGAFAYDVAGNMVQRNVDGQLVTLEYDGDNRLRRRTLPSGATETYYYHAGMRWLSVTRTSSGAVEEARFRFDGTEVVYDCELGTCGRDRTRTTILHGSRVVARFERDELTGNHVERILHANGLGHVLGAYAFDMGPGNEVLYDIEVGFQYSPFGEVLETIDAGADGAASYTQRFNGKDVDLATGLTYYGYRYYDPVAMIWTRSDPLYRFVPDRAIADPRSGNLYTFSGNNPIRYVDPDGLENNEGLGTSCANPSANPHCTPPPRDDVPETKHAPDEPDAVDAVSVPTSPARRDRGRMQQRQRDRATHAVSMIDRGIALFGIIVLKKPDASVAFGLTAASSTGIRMRSGNTYDRVSAGGQTAANYLALVPHPAAVITSVAVSAVTSVPGGRDSFGDQVMLMDRIADVYVVELPRGIQNVAESAIKVTKQVAEAQQPPVYCNQCSER